MGGRGWFGRIEKSLRDANGVICLITNNRSGTNNWLNLEVGAAMAEESFSATGIGVLGGSEHALSTKHRDRALLQASMDAQERSISCA